MSSVEPRVVEGEERAEVLRKAGIGSVGGTVTVTGDDKDNPNIPGMFAIVGHIAGDVTINRVGAPGTTTFIGKKKSTSGASVEVTYCAGNAHISNDFWNS